jgi:DNA-binding transcriptional LysR family regulator
VPLPAEAIRECAKSNMGIFFLRRIAAAQDLADGKFKQLKLTRTFGTQTKLQLVVYKDKWLSPALTAFIETVKGRG